MTGIHADESSNYASYLGKLCKNGQATGGPWAPAKSPRVGSMLPCPAHGLSWAGSGGALPAHGRVVARSMLDRDCYKAKNDETSSKGGKF